jgi:AmiR/NasT family two-component response regulator
MENYQKDTPEKNSKNPIQDLNSSMQEKSQMGESLALSEGKSQLDTFVLFIKSNWRTVLAELVAAGVAAYLTHGEQEKAHKEATKN